MASRPKAGFGVPETEIDPQHFIVEISQTGRELVTVIEDYGITGPKHDLGTNEMLDQVVRCRIDPRRWRQVATPLRSAFNERLKSRKLPTGRWEAGRNRVHRLLGREMCVLLWAIERCEEGKVPTAINAWTGLRPEERWWLYAMAAHASGRAGDHDGGWRKAIHFGLTEGATMPDSGRSSLLDRL
jgi:hypothetical protein